MKSRFLLLLIIIASGCNNDEVRDLKRKLGNLNTALTIADAKNVIFQKDQNNNLITSVSKNDTGFSFTFEDETVLEVQPDLIDSVGESTLEWRAKIYYSDKSEQVAAFLGSEEAITVKNVTRNPYNTAPLTARAEVILPVDSKVTWRVKGKNGTSSDIIQTSQSDGKLHNLNIAGLYANHNNTIELTFTSQDGKERGQKIFSVQTEPLPTTFPEIIVDVMKPEKMEEGLTLVSYYGANNPQIPFVMDGWGDVRWYLDYSKHAELKTLRYDNGIERLQNGNLYFGDINTDKIYEVDIFGQIQNTWKMPGYHFHHNVQEKPNGNFLVTVDKEGSIHLNGSPTNEDYIIEIDRTSGTIINEWDLKQSLDEYRTALLNNLSAPVIDWVHVNAVIYDPSDNSIIVSGRTQGLIKLTNDNRVKWILGPHKNWGTARNGEDLNQFLLKPVNSANALITDQAVLDGDVNHADFEWNWYQHAPLIMPNGNIMMFDNGGATRNYTGTEKYSRSVEYQISEADKTVKQVWSYGKERGISCFSTVVSDVDYLPGKKNVLFNPGFNVDNNGKFGGKVVEVNYDTKEVVFEVRINPPAGIITLHRAERIKLF